LNIQVLKLITINRVRLGTDFIGQMWVSLKGPGVRSLKPEPAEVEKNVKHPMIDLILSIPEKPVNLQLYGNECKNGYRSNPLCE